MGYLGLGTRNLLGVPIVPQLRTAAAEFWKALGEAFVRHSVLIFLTLSLLFLALYGMVSDSGRPIMPEEQAFPAPRPTPFNPLQGILVVAVYGLAGLLFGALIWVGIPALVVSFVVSLSKFTKRRSD